MNPDHLVWIDLELTDLSVEQGEILELAIIVTDWNLEEKARQQWVIKPSDDLVIEKMEPFVKRMHERSGLLDAVKSEGVSREVAEYQACLFLVPFISKSGRFVVGGNSVHLDRLFIERRMPVLDQFLHFRLIDATPIGLLSERWCPEQYKEWWDQPGGNERSNHRALEDIEKCLNRMRVYRESLFIRPPITPTTLAS